MKSRLLGALAVFVLSFYACTPDREFAPPPKAPPAGGANNIVEGTLRINEFLASGSTFSNELEATGSDWIEIYNTTSDTIPLVGGNWFVTDTLGFQTLFELPDTSILPNGFLVLWCDDHDTTITQIHTNFGLSKNGEEIGLSYISGDSINVLVDSYVYPVQTSAVSMGRYPDGTTNWIFSNNPSPSNSNQE